MLTMHFLQMRTDRNDSAIVEVYDGISGAGKLLASVKVRNGTLPQSVTSTGQDLFMKFTAESRTNTIVFVRLSSGYSKRLFKIYTRFQDFQTNYSLMKK